jgi:hypothetical protein
MSQMRSLVKKCSENTAGRIALGMALEWPLMAAVSLCFSAVLLITFTERANTK